MKYLLDTHIFLWWLTKNPRLRSSVRLIIENPRNQIFISVVNAWEISIKSKIGKLPLKTTLEDAFAEPGFEILPVTISHIFALNKLTLIHKDPFDRMLIAQAIVEKCTILTDDAKFRKYKVAVKF